MRKSVTGRSRRVKKSVRKNRKNLLLVGGVVLILCFAMSYKQVQLESKKTAYEKELETLNKQLLTEEERAEQIEDYQAYVETKKYIEEEAREKLGLVYPDEIIFEAEQ